MKLIDYKLELNKKIQKDELEDYESKGWIKGRKMNFSKNPKQEKLDNDFEF